MIDQTIREKWMTDKWAMFSGSNIHKLNGPADKGGGMFGTGAMTYIREIASQANSRFSERAFRQSYSMMMGSINEPQAFGHLYKELNEPEELIYYGEAVPAFFKYNAHSGCSPDAVAWKDVDTLTASFGVEFKCPEPETHFEYIIKINNEADLLKHKPEYWWQCQFATMVFKCDHWLWCSYDEFSHTPMICIEVEANKKVHQSLDLRISQAVIEKNKLLEIAKKRIN